jgi:cell division topological specificity factor
MSWLGRMLGREKKSAKVAKDRLMIAIATDRDTNLTPYMEKMRAEIIEVIKKYTEVDELQISKVQKEDIEVLEINAVVKQ